MSERRITFKVGLDGFVKVDASKYGGSVEEVLDKLKGIASILGASPDDLKVEGHEEHAHQEHEEHGHVNE